MPKTIRLSVNWDDLPSLLVPTRMDMFGTVTLPAKGKRKAKTISTGWQGWNPDSTMEQRMARLPGAGSFYWPNAWRAYWTAKELMLRDSTLHQIKLETISGREIARLYREVSDEN